MTEYNLNKYDNDKLIYSNNIQNTILITILIVMCYFIYMFNIYSYFVIYFTYIKNKYKYTMNTI